MDVAAANDNNANTNANGNANANGNTNANGNANANSNTNTDNAGNSNANSNANSKSNNGSEKSQERKEKFDNVSKPTKNNNKKTDTKISQLITSKEPKGLAKKAGLDYNNGRLRVMINLDISDESVLSKIKQVANIEILKDGFAQIDAPVNEFQNILSLTGVKNIKPMTPAVQNRDVIVDGKVVEDSVFSESVTSGNKSVSVAIIDLGFDVTDEKIVDNVEEGVSFRHIFGRDDSIRGNEDEYLHGTAMAQIITDLAPGAKLHLLAAANELEFLEAMDYAISKNVDIITISYTWVNYDTDGTSLMTKKVEEAVNSGITVITPSGNYAQNHWSGKFVDTDGNRWNEFANGDEGMTINVDDERLAEQKPILVYLRWDDSSEIADFDLTLTGPTGQILDYSSNQQTQSSDEPIEYLYYVPDMIGDYSIGISNFGYSTNTTLEIFSVYDELEYQQPEKSAAVPSDARGAVVVGSLGGDAQRRSYSSVGPTENGLSVPNILAPDGISTQIYDDPFTGTSSSAAYVSGLIAILYAEDENIDSNFITQTLFNKITGSEPAVGSDLEITGFAGKINDTATPTRIKSDATVAQSAGHAVAADHANGDDVGQETRTCEADMIMILKRSTLTPACVMEISAEKLIARGWGIMPSEQDVDR